MTRERQSTDSWVQAVNKNTLVVFMKGSPEAPQCGFSRAVCQILEVQVCVFAFNPAHIGCLRGRFLS